MVDVLRWEIVEIDLRGAEDAEKMNPEGLPYRRCLVVQNDIGNRNSPLTIVAPITKAEHDKGLPVQVAVTEDQAVGLDRASVIECGQVRTVDLSERARHRIGYIKDDTVKAAVETALMVSLGLAAISAPPMVPDDDIDQDLVDDLAALRET